jgi:hypothetical protein
MVRGDVQRPRDCPARFVWVHLLLDQNLRHFSVGIRQPLLLFRIAHIKML